PADRRHEASSTGGIIGPDANELPSATYRSPGFSAAAAVAGPVSRITAMGASTMTVRSRRRTSGPYTRGGDGPLTARPGRVARVVRGVVAGTGVDPVTPRFSGACSAD